MSTNPLKNVPLSIFQKFLTKQGCKNVRTTGGHQHWSRADLLRPITIQTHIDPIPERILKQALAALDIDKESFKGLLDSL